MCLTKIETTFCFEGEEETVNKYEACIVLLWEIYCNINKLEKVDNISFRATNTYGIFIVNEDIYFNIEVDTFNNIINLSYKNSCEGLADRYYDKFNATLLKSMHILSSKEGNSYDQSTKRIAD